MSRVLNTTLGYYEPAFFHINIGTNSSFEKFSSRDFSIFLHEYIHFIQDVTTVYGLNNMYVYSEYIRFATNKVYGSQSKKFSVPIVPLNDNHDNVFLNRQICKLTFGDSDEIKKVVKIVDIITENQSTGVIGSAVDNIESILVICNDDLGEEWPVTFGALSIMENMSYLMEQLICTDYDSSPDFPYSFAEKIVEKIYPEFGKEKLNILALCDLSLQYNNPGKIFVQFLQDMFSVKWLPESPEEIYDSVYKRRNTLNGEGENSIEDVYNQLSLKVRNQVQGYFNDPELFTDIRNWINQLLKTAQEIRFDNKYFILDIARGGKDVFQSFFKQLGTPLISNSTGECTLLYPDKPEGVEIGYFIAIGQIISYFESGSCRCDLLNICKKYKNKIDQRCESAPWERCFDTLLCPYALLWKHWNLKEYTPL